ncbi:PREDICTED: uncharacterized protein LOC106804756 [Priapulus caudatus]|uniref:Uncharacterized protein LOC106804756 n=1 Tax=Priapulus caudatus TaxID=37621 RepID=A0ABM1DNP3_PRICU|nr:PREDICTED: uncharacterized protein LOC106804756 [Priapulus caudatus]
MGRLKIKWVGNMRVILPIAMAVLALFASAPSSGLDIDEVLPFLTDEYLNDLSSVFTGSLHATLEDELAAVNAEVASLEEGCRPKPKPKPTPKPAPLRITAGKDPLICQRCTEKKLRHQIKMCALMLMWGPPSCRRIEEKVRLYSDVEARTTEAAKLFRWYRCLCDGTGNGYNSFTDECSAGPTSEMIGRSLTHCGIDAANFRDLQGALLNDGRDITELLGRVNCEGVFNERDADKISAKQPYCPALMAGQDFYQGCLYFAGDPTCECFNSGVEPLAIRVEPEEPVTESPLPLNPADCPGLEDALCRQATAKTRVARKNPLIITNVTIATSIPHNHP